MIRLIGFCIKNGNRNCIQKIITRNFRITSCVPSLKENFREFENNSYQKKYEFSKYLIGAITILGNQ